MSAVSMVIDRLLQGQHRLYVIVSGAGAGIQKLLWDRPGTSKFLVGAEFPYDRAATARVLGFEPEKAVSRKTAIQFAQEAYLRACQGSGQGEPIGLGLTAAVTTDRERRGANRVHVVAMSKATTIHFQMEIAKGAGQTVEDLRKSDGEVCDNAAFWALSSVLINSGKPGPWTEVVSEEEQREVLFERPFFMPNGGRYIMAALQGNALLPGSYNPPHEGHLGMMLTMAHAGYRPVYAITADSLHKPSLVTTELLRRVAMLKREDFPVLLTQEDPLFIHKARQLPGRAIAIGVDTLERLLESRWFKLPNGDAVEGIDPYWTASGEVAIHAMLAEFRRLGTRFLVFERNGKTITDVRVPGDYRELFEALPGRWDISSTQLRQQTGR